MVGDGGTIAVGGLKTQEGNSGSKWFLKRMFMGVYEGYRGWGVEVGGGHSARGAEHTVAHGWGIPIRSSP